MEYNVVWLSSIFPSRFTLYSFLPRMTITGVACSFLPASFTREQREDWVMRWTDHLPARCVMAVTPTSTHTHTCSGSLLCLWSQVLFSFPDLLGTERMVCLAGLGPTIFFFFYHPWKGQSLKRAMFLVSSPQSTQFSFSDSWNFGLLTFPQLCTTTLLTPGL